MTDKKLLEQLKIQSMIYVCFRIGDLHDRSLFSVAEYIGKLYDEDMIYKSYINAITILEYGETKSSE